jgi:aryl-alcohol dehydrogenase-like predicted oxidoreductase
MYSGGQSEIILGKALKEINAPRESFVIMTKLYYPTLANGEMTMDQLAAGEKPEDFGLVNQWGLSRKNIFDSIKDSLKRLDVEYVDVLQCHRFDKDVEIPEIMKALDDVVKSGMVRYIGMSSCWAWQFHAMQSKSSQLLRLVLYDATPPPRLRTREWIDTVHFHAKPLFFALP